MNIHKNIPRILTIIFILLLSILAFDAENIIGWLIHMIPSFVLIGILIFAWKKPLIGSIAFLVMGIIFTIFFKTYEDYITFAIVSLPLFIIAGLFFCVKK